MIDPVVTPERPSETELHAALPMRGAVLAALASAFRLGDKCRDQAAGLSPGTAKRVFQDEPAVRADKRTAVTRTFVTGLFPLKYLRARGLDEREAAVHGELLVAALDDLLDRWEDVARSFNHVGRVEARFEWLLEMSGLSLDCVARIAAYLCIYSRLHPALNALESWLAKPGLKGVYDELLGRTSRRISIEQQCKATGLTKNAIKALRDGETGSPQGETLERLALCFEKYGAARRAEDGPATAAEIEVELRVAAALTRVRTHFREEERCAWLWVQRERLRHMRSELRRFSRDELASLLVQGPRAPLWANVERLAQQGAMSMLIGAAAEMNADVARRWAQFPEDPAGAMRSAAEGFAEQANALRRSLAYHRSGEGDGRQLANVMDDMGASLRAMADSVEGKQESIPLEFKTDQAALEAETCVMNALAPWHRRSRAETIKLLRDAVAAGSSSATPRRLLALHLLNDGEFDAAIAHFYALVGEHPDDSEARYELALSLSCAERTADAIAELDELERRGGGSAVSDALRGHCLVDLGRYVEAEASFQRALIDNERLISALDGMARCRRFSGDERGARDYERRREYYGRMVPEGRPKHG